MSRFAFSLLFSFAAVAGLLLASTGETAPLFQANSIHYVTNLAFHTGSALGDFDGDGHLDYAFVVKNFVQTARGHGDGTFDPAFSLPGAPAGAPKAADLNGDGFADLVVSGWGGLAIRYGGPGGLGAPIFLNAFDFAQFMDVADVNGDGRLDLVMGLGPDVVVRFATGPTTYAPALASPTGLIDQVDGVVAGDIDEDGKLDLLMDTNPYGVGVLGWMRGHGDGTFDPATSIATQGSSPLFLADLNGDHHLDEVDYGAWRLGDGHGNFGPPAVLGPDIFIYGVGDVTGDGALDLVCLATANPSLPNAYSFDLYRNDGAGSFTRASSQSLLNFSRPSLGDVNGDGLNDVFAPDDVSGNMSVHLSNGDGTFGNGRNFATGNRPSGIVLAEITGDGRPDAITSDKADGTVSVLPGLPGGQFGAPIAYAVGTSPSGIVTGDLNGDGRADIVTADAGSNTVSVLLGQPGGGLGSAVATPAGTTPFAVAVGDIDRDGHLDVVVVDQGSSTLQILRGNGAGGLTPGSSYSTSFFPARLVIGDLDGNAWPDVVVATGRSSGSNNFVDVFRGDGSGGLLPKASYVGGWDVGISDMNGDGLPDVVTINPSVIVGVLYGTGGGVLAPISSTYRATRSRAIAIADDNGDGKPDIFTAGDWVSCVWFARGLGGGTFANAEGYGTERGANGLVVADLDGDGTLDVVTSDGDTSLVSVLMGISPGPVPALATLVSAEATGSGVRIVWLTGSSAANVERSENGGAWAPMGQIVSDASGLLTFEDRDVKPGSDYVYRLGFDRGGETVYAGPVSVHVPVSASLRLAPGSNPSLGTFSASFSLPDARPARLELYDVSGRRVLTRDVGGMGPGTHVLRLGETSQLSSGVYWLRLVHPERTLVARAALVH